MYSLQNKVFISGHQGMVGSALLRVGETRGQEALLTADRKTLDLCDQRKVYNFLKSNKPDAVIIAAAKVGGIHANDTYPAEFISNNLQIALNLIHGSYLAGIQRVLFLGSSCIYPKFAPQPMPEECLLTSELEPTNEAYAIAKIAGLKLCEYHRKQYGVLYHSAMPTNLYGSGDNYHQENSHVIPALIRRFHEAKERKDSVVTIWGTGTPRREFLHVDDLAEACWYLMGLEDPPDRVNLGTGTDVTILELAQLVAKTVGFEGEIQTDSTKPDGTPRKLLDISVLNEIGYRSKIKLAEGLKMAYQDFLEGAKSGKLRV